MLLHSAIIRITWQTINGRNIVAKYYSKNNNYSNQASENGHTREDQRDVPIVLSRLLIKSWVGLCVCVCVCACVCGVHAYVHVRLQGLCACACTWVCVWICACPVCVTCMRTFAGFTFLSHQHNILEMLLNFDIILYGVIVLSESRAKDNHAKFDTHIVSEDECGYTAEQCPPTAAKCKDASNESKNKSWCPNVWTIECLGNNNWLRGLTDHNHVRMMLLWVVK